MHDVLLFNLMWFSDHWLIKGYFNVINNVCIALWFWGFCEVHVYWCGWQRLSGFGGNFVRMLRCAVVEKHKEVKCLGDGNYGD